MRHTIARDGIVAGVLAATAVAVWFLGLDVLYAQPLATPTALGRGLLRIFGPPGNEGPLVFVTAYTIFHYAAFIVAGLIVSVIVHWAQTQPTVLAGAMILFVAFEIGFYGLSAALQESPFLGALGWAQVASGNLVAAVVMGVYMWRTHPELKGELSYALGGRE
jgi:MFS-type transporter involved in bile tolerance (Atg22 family)